MLKLAYGLSFAELYERDGLVRLDAAFLDHLGAAESALRPQLEAARATDTLDPKAESALIIEIAPHLDDFLAKLFGIEYYDERDRRQGICHVVGPEQGFTLADGNSGFGYVYRVGGTSGVEVQAVYSDARKAFVVADGDRCRDGCGQQDFNLERSSCR